MIKNLRRSVATGGNIKIGGKGASRPTRDGKGSWAPPRKDDHFTITKTIRENGDPNANLIVNTEIMTALIQQGWADDDGLIRRLPIALLRDDIDEVFTTAYVAYAGKSLACRGDGETATRYIDPHSGKPLPAPIEVSCPCERLEKDADGTRRCKFNGILHCSLRLPGHAVIGSCYRWRTTSEISCQQMVTHLEDILDAAGTLRGLPLVLVLRPQQVSPGGKPKTVHVCHIDLCEDLVIAQRAALEAATMRKQLAGSLLAVREEQYRATLQLPGDEDDDERADVISEYYPDISTAIEATAEAVPAEALAVLSAPVPVAPHPAPREPEPPAAAPPARPATPPPVDDDSGKRQRRTKCKSCGEYFGPGNVQKGKCEACRGGQQPTPPPPESENPEPAPEPAPESNGPTPKEIIRQAYQEAMGNGKTGAEIGDVLTAAWKNWADRDWTIADANKAAALIRGMCKP